MNPTTIQTIKETAALLFFFSYLFFAGAMVLKQFHKEKKYEEDYINRTN